MKKRIVVEAPASSANLGPGFDVFAIALARPLDRLSLTAQDSSHPKARIRVSGVSHIPTTPERNAAGFVALTIARDYDLRANLDIRLRKGIPVGIGLGSSAASSAAAALAMDRYFELGMNHTKLISYAARGEEVSAGAMHFDNVSASIVGGFVIVIPDGEPKTIAFPPPSSLRLCLATPRVKLPERKTEFARSLLPSKVEIPKIVHNLAMASALVSGFALGDVGLIGSGMKDEIVEPARAGMFPAYDRVRRAALEKGASGVCISGAGPTVLAAADSRRISSKVVMNAMLSAFEDSGSKAIGFITSVGGGARVVEG